MEIEVSVWSLLFEYILLQLFAFIQSIAYIIFLKIYSINSKPFSFHNIMDYLHKLYFVSPTIEPYSTRFT